MVFKTCFNTADTLNVYTCNLKICYERRRFTKDCTTTNCSRFVSHLIYIGEQCALFVRLLEEAFFHHSRIPEKFHLSSSSILSNSMRYNNNNNNNNNNATISTLFLYFPSSSKSSQVDQPTNERSLGRRAIFEYYFDPDNPTLYRVN